MNKKRWQTLLGALKLEDSSGYFAALEACYKEPHRFYHTTQHIEAMLKHFDAVRELAEYPDELELAIWFHDAIYKPFSSSNERDSANWAKQFLERQSFSADGVERVERMIMATLHNGEAHTDDEKLIVDIDLSILGTPEQVYNEFEKNVRKEYRLVPSFIYRRKRKALLQAFLAMESVYHFDYFKKRYEAKARSNILNAINTL